MCCAHRIQKDEERWALRRPHRKKNINCSIKSNLPKRKCDWMREWVTIAHTFTIFRQFRRNSLMAPRMCRCIYNKFFFSWIAICSDISNANRRPNALSQLCNCWRFCSRKKKLNAIISQISFSVRSNQHVVIGGLGTHFTYHIQMSRQGGFARIHSDFIRYRPTFGVVSAAAIIIYHIRFSIFFAWFRIWKKNCTWLVGIW